VPSNRRDARSPLPNPSRRSAPRRRPRRPRHRLGSQ
jgi:hypothetical protein